MPSVSCIAHFKISGLLFGGESAFGPTSRSRASASASVKPALRSGASQSMRVENRAASSALFSVCSSNARARPAGSIGSAEKVVRRGWDCDRSVSARHQLRAGSAWRAKAKRR